MNRKIDVNNTLLFAAPQIAAQWHETLNGDLKPENVSKWSVNKAWWKCEKGHEWEAYINNRTKRNDGCPYCSGRYATQEECLEVLYPEVALDWHPTKNKELTPDKVKPFSEKKVWWKCRNNPEHEWQAIIGSKVKSVVDSKGCPYCSGKKACKENNLAVVEPILALEWHPTKNKKLSPKDVTPSSNKKVWWECKVCNHEWEVAINSRNGKNNKRGCPICHRGYQTSFPEQAILYYMNQLFEGVENGKELICAGKVFKIDVYIPEINLAIEYDGEYAHKNKLERDLEKSSAILNNGMKLVRIREPKLPSFEIREVKVIYRKESTNNRSLKNIIDELMDWILQNNSLGKYTVDKISKLKNGDFNHHILIIEESVKINRKNNSIAFTHPKIAKQWHPSENLSLSPWNYTKNSSKTVWWKCEKGHEYKAKIVDKTDKCLVCTNKIVHISNCLATTHPLLSEEWHPTKNVNLTPYHIVAGTPKKVWWLCNVCSYEWRTSVAKRRGSARIAGTRCPACCNKTVTNKNCLAVTSPKVAKEWHPTKNGVLTPNDITAGSDKRAWWLCQTCHNEWDAPIYHRKKTGCPLCGNRRIGKKLFKSNEEFIAEIKKLVGDEYIPQEEYKGATTYIAFLHVACGNILRTSPSKFKSTGKRCQCEGK